MSLFIHRAIRKVNKPNKSHAVSTDIRKVNKKLKRKFENMDSITATNTITCDIEITNKVLNLHAKHFTKTTTTTTTTTNDGKHQNYVLLSKSCQDRMAAVVNIAIDLFSYLINLCASFGWQSAHTIYCIKFIRINQRALIQHLKSIRLLESFKEMAIIAAINARRKLHPITKMLKRKKIYDDCDSDDNDFIKKSKSHQIDQQSNDTNNNVNNEQYTAADNDADNDDDDDESDSVSLEILWQPQSGTQITADVVFIHGLHGSSDSTWCQGEWVHENDGIQIKHHENHNHHNNIVNDADSTVNDMIVDSLSQCWPKDWLPLDFPTARICAINYDTDPHLWRPIWYQSRKRSSLAIRAMKMIRILVEHKIGVDRPIIWVGHSKGGLYIKQIIVNAHECNAFWLWKSSRAVLFYSVPHRGSPLADLNLPLLTRSIEMIEIQKNFSTIMDLHRRFVTLCRKGILSMDIFSFIEMKFTELSVFYLRIIGIDSGDPGIGGVCTVPLDHLDVCKPRNRNCFLYRQLANMIKSAIHTHNLFDSFDMDN